MEKERAEHLEMKRLEIMKNFIDSFVKDYKKLKVKRFLYNFST